MMSLRGLDSRVRPYAERAMERAHREGITPVVTSVYRSWEEQTALRARYELGQSRFPANRPGDSAHQYGLAFDSVVPADQQERWNKIRRDEGLQVLANDIIHAQVENWRTLIRAGAAEPVYIMAGPPLAGIDPCAC